MQEFVLSAVFLYATMGRNLRQECMYLIKKFFLFLLIFLSAVSLLCGKQEGTQKRDKITFRSYYPSDIPFNYQNLYLSYRLNWAPVENVTINLSLVKGSGAHGYYPQGYVYDSDRGLYEKGSYSILLEDYFKLHKIIVGNYLPLFGQGILFGGIFPLLWNNPYYELARYRNGIYPTGSSSKTVLLEGIALEYRTGVFAIRPFLSWNHYDCTAGESSYYKYNDNDWDGIHNEDDEDDFSGFSDEFPTGYSCKNNIFSAIRDEPDYEIESDREKRNNLSELLAGMNLSSRMDNLRIGWTVSYAQFNRLVDPYYNFDPGEGEKTSYYFRGKNYYSTNVYFKLYRPLEVFGEAAWTFYRSLSYYPEFHKDFISSIGFSGGIRKKINHIGLILWGSYIPPTLVNPHGQEYPDGLNNIASGLSGISFVKGKKRYAHWIYGYKELANKDNSNNFKTGISYSQRIELPLSEGILFRTKQNLEIVDHHYYAPDDLSRKISSKVSFKYSITEEVAAQFSLENRFGGPFGKKLFVGTGLSTELLYKKEKNRSSVQVIYYNTDSDRFATLYPYERSLYNWSFFAPSLNGNGFAGSLIGVRSFKSGMVAGSKIRYEIDLKDSSKRGITLYVMSEIPF